MFKVLNFPRVTSNKGRRSIGTNCDTFTLSIKFKMMTEKKYAWTILPILNLTSVQYEDTSPYELYLSLALDFPWATETGGTNATARA